MTARTFVEIEDNYWGRFPDPADRDYADDPDDDDPEWLALLADEPTEPEDVQ